MKAVAFLMLIFAWKVSQTFDELEAKSNIMLHLAKATPSITGIFTLTILHSIFSVMAALIIKMLFMLFSVYNTA